MKVKDFIELLEVVHELVFLDANGKHIFSCDSDSIIMDSVANWTVESFKVRGSNPVNEWGVIRLVVSKP